MKTSKIEKLIRFFVGFFLIFLSFSVGTYSGLVRAGENGNEFPTSNHEISSLTKKYKTHIKEASQTSEDQWSGNYYSSVYGELIIDKAKGFFLKRNSAGCIISNVPPSIGGVIRKKKSIQLRRYPVAYTARLDEDLNNLIMFEHKENYYLVPQKFSSDFLQKVEKISERCDSPYDCETFFFVKKS